MGHVLAQSSTDKNPSIRSVHQEKTAGVRDVKLKRQILYRYINTKLLLVTLF